MKNKSKMNQLLFGITLLIGMLVTVSCEAPTTQAQEPTPVTKAVFDIGAAKKMIEARNVKLMSAMHAKDASAVADCYTKDGKFMTPNAPSFVGRAAIQANSEGGIAAGATELNLTLVDLWGNETMLFEEGTYTIGNSKGVTFDQGKYLILWMQEDGIWKMHRDMYNSDMPLPTDES